MADRPTDEQLECFAKMYAASEFASVFGELSEARKQLAQSAKCVTIYHQTIDRQNQQLAAVRKRLAEAESLIAAYSMLSLRCETGNPNQDPMTCRIRRSSDSLMAAECDVCRAKRMREEYEPQTDGMIAMEEPDA